MFEAVRFRAFVQLTAQEADDPSQFDARVLAKLRTRFEGVYSKIGYAVPGSLRLLQRSLGRLTVAHFNGHVSFECVCAASACNPRPGLRVRGVVTKVTPAVVLAEVSHALPNMGRPLVVMVAVIPRTAVELTSEIDLGALSEKDDITIEVVSKRFSPSDARIQVIGRAVASDAPPPPASATTADRDIVNVSDASDDADDEDDVEDDDDIDDGDDGGSASGAEDAPEADLEKAAPLLPDVEDLLGLASDGDVDSDAIDSVSVGGSDVSGGGGAFSDACDD